MTLLRLKNFRDKYSIPREELANMLGITIDTLNNWEYRTKKVPASKSKNIDYVISMYESGKSIESKPSEKSNEPTHTKNGVTFTLKEAVMLVVENQEEALKIDAYKYINNNRAMKILIACVKDDGILDREKYLAELEK